MLLLVPAGIYFTIRTRFCPDPQVSAYDPDRHGKTNILRRAVFPDFRLSLFATATRVGMGNLVGVVAAISAGGAGAVFWMWLLALLGSSTAFAEGTLAQIYRQKDPLYGGYRGGPAYHPRFYDKEKTKKQNRPAKRNVTA